MELQDATDRGKYHGRCIKMCGCKLELRMKIRSPLQLIFPHCCFVYQHAIGRKFKSKGEKHDHWLDFAADTFDQQLIKDIKQVFHVLVLYLPIPVFWALYDQQVTFIFFKSLSKFLTLPVGFRNERALDGCFKLLEWMVL